MGWPVTIWLISLPVIGAMVMPSLLVLVRVEGGGTVVQDAMTLNSGDPVEIRFHRGQARARIESTRKD